SYRRGRGQAARDARAAAVARRDTARRIAGDLVVTHGTDLTIEAGSVAVWARTWGRAVHAFTPGLLVAAFQREVAAIRPGVQVKRAGTRRTAMSQHCLCGHRHKKSLSERTHRCTACGLEGGRDAVAAVLASCVEFSDSADPTTATVDYTLTGKLLNDPATWHTLHQTIKTSGVQERPWASTDTPDPTPGVGQGTRLPVTAGSAPRTGQVPTTTPDEPPTGDHAGTRSTTNPNAPPRPSRPGLRDICDVNECRGCAARSARRDLGGDQV
ncbi:MAG TPA: zinc ribbon domain-containing protein, partial [Euzebya sp.]|nr:zinc ribbon domain-containing protein [Euzebya sp.]